MQTRQRKPSVLRSRWKLLELLGRGAMGEVHLAHDELLQRDVAVKLLSAPFLDDPSMVDRFRREALASARLAHPNVVTTLDFGVHEDTPFIVMELVRGVALDIVLHREGPMRPLEVARLGTQLAKGLGAAHQQGVVHRDIKPGNVMISGSGDARVARLMDFGVAQAPNAGPRLTMVGGAVGTPGYVAPEQLSGDPVGPAADLYALGITMYEMLSGRLPWPDDEPLALLTAALRDPATPLGTCVPETPRVLVELVMSLIEREPAARPVDAASVVERLEAFTRAMTTSQRRASMPGASEASVVVASLSREPDVAALQTRWFRSAVEAEGGSVAQSIRREVVAVLPATEAALRLTRSFPGSGQGRPAIGVDVGITQTDVDDVVLGPAVRVALRLARLGVADEVLLTQAAHDALGLGWRARLHPRGEFVLGPDLRHAIFALGGDEASFEGSASLEAHPDGVHWRCSCSAHGAMPVTAEQPTRLRCSGCSRLLQFRPTQFASVAPAVDRAHDEHPLSSILLTAPPRVTTEDAETDNQLVDALSSFDQ